MKQIIENYYFKMGKDFTNCFSEIISAMMCCRSSSSGAIANQMSKLNNFSFKTNDMKIHRFFKSNTFQINEKFWRMHMSLIFDMLNEHKIINYQNPVEILVDCTTSCDDFLIMMASIVIDNKAVCLYYNTRVYPKRKNRMNYQKMENSFIKGLRQVLSKKYSYLIVADRGFGIQRFINLCKKNNFGYVIRMNSNLKVKDSQNNQKNLQQFDKTNIKNIDLHVNLWDQKINIETSTSKDSTWFLIKSSKELNGKEIYEKRFKIEKLFQDNKTSGFNIEKNKIKKYDRFRRMLYCCQISHLLLTLLGKLITSNKSNENLKKNFSQKFENISVYLPQAIEQSPISILNLWSSLSTKYLD